jgi:hypothetical protein
MPDKVSEWPLGENGKPTPPRELQQLFYKVAEEQYEKLRAAGLLATKFSITGYGIDMMASGYHEAMKKYTTKAIIENWDNYCEAASQPTGEQREVYEVWVKKMVDSLPPADWPTEKCLNWINENVISKKTTIGSNEAECPKCGNNSKAWPKWEDWQENLLPILNRFAEKSNEAMYYGDVWNGIRKNVIHPLERELSQAMEEIENLRKLLNTATK